ncbi:MAG: protein-L-isoaspartate O-methyltransferase [Candidatus Infernicultor aquiphilus]|uniref:Protein-L-isoaspartate O-methyltransferase n=1 Tax=Candidatus Infernicultor aquiphilus TaxID=1805029 RepID=A0A1J5GUB3_9BACT|nr:protein-L-isoaspartate(D-aspartate) O-methyltransferase [bacterium]OIP71390.1 MAG: protein-L-isoaspartate O-methyltransferase [Candidatus Atribacteria bacterium CG2_30_33_13]PIU25402.1 MAG: protein-L-isoaspartate O-methyltransferase [Candidatus Atribacteria bacterium CG08_land_8_20_14_0_20_33_29]PIX34710.1 MAG: protein-L-isoaspartate O-methyltransferase [Candidatus Atribacteria bacterium CG_4_8_14_3_um_filter_34_18]PIY33626.1 MAG: protein-L-isoaspartate O-methyltransferase [Candidatus Atriba
MDFEKAREEMIRYQIKGRGIKDKRVLWAMSMVPREKFVLKENEKEAYLDCPLPLGMGQTISQPYMVALMTQCLTLEGSECILEVGTGSGYQAAILSKLAKMVYTVERLKNLADRAEKIFKELEIKNVKVVGGDGTNGLKEYSPYDGIIVTAGAPEIPQSLISQLKERGRIVIPVGNSFSQDLLLGKKEKGKLKIQNYGGCIFVPLLGKYGW